MSRTRVVHEGTEESGGGWYVRWDCNGAHRVMKGHKCGMPCSFGPVSESEARAKAAEWEQHGTPLCWTCVRQYADDRLGGGGD